MSSFKEESNARGKL